jgi:GTP-binding protein
VLVDVTIPPQELDVQLLDWLRHVDRSFLLVATKADRISGNQLRTSLRKLSEQLGVLSDQIIPFSAKVRVGHDELWKAIKVAAGVEDSGTHDIAKTGS